MHFNSLIIGPGAIGALVCAQLQRQGNVAVFNHRPGIILAEKLTTHNQAILLDWQLENSFASFNADVIWVCCKAHQTESAVPKALTQHPNAAVVLLHNGMGPQQALIERYGDAIVPSSTTCGALPTSSGGFKQTAFGETLIGQSPIQQKKFERLAHFISSQEASAPPMRFKPSQDIWPLLWRKVLINACINPITAYHQVQNGELIADRYQQEWRPVMAETLKVMQACGIQMPSDPAEAVMTVIRNSAQNWSSMAMDAKHGRTTEIDAINGFLIQQAARFEIDVPHLKKWYKRIAFPELS